MTGPDETYDVIVVGCGFAGGIAAIEAHDAGANVLVLEKMPTPGGISICSAGGLRIAGDADGAFAYLQATNAGTTPDPVLRALADGMTRLAAYVRGLGDGTGAVVGERPGKGNYPLPGHETFGFVYVDDIPGFDPARTYPHVQGSPAGARLFSVIEDNLQRRRIDLRVNSPVRRLETDSAGAVKGVVVEDTDGTRRFGARRAVILTCGGFEGAPDMQRQYWQAKPVLNAAFRGNTGDGIRMAQALGADLWHMWHFHGSYGFRHVDPNYPFAIRTKRLPDWLPGEGPPSDVRMAWILLDRQGRRFMNEYEPYLQDTGARPMERFRPEIQDYSALPAWLITDEDGRRLYSLGRPTYNESGVVFDWSADNLREIDLGILRRAETIEDMAAQMELSAVELQASIEKWNHACAAGDDREFGRPPTSMHPIARPPYVFAPVWPVVSNTQGGPVHDKRQRIIDVFGAPVRRLYAAGELGSAFGHLYISGGNLAECFIGGRIAGRAAATETPRDGAG